MTELNGATYDGKVISVTEARPREERPRTNNFNRGGGNRNGGFGGGRRNFNDNSNGDSRY